MEKYTSGPAGAYFEQTGEWFESRWNYRHPCYLVVVLTYIGDIMSLCAVCPSDRVQCLSLYIVIFSNGHRKSIDKTLCLRCRQL
jgi:hypothetical protein